MSARDRLHAPESLDIAPYQRAQHNDYTSTAAARGGKHGLLPDYGTVGGSEEAEALEEERLERNRMLQRCGFRFLWFLLGAGLSVGIFLLVLKFRRSGSSSTPVEWRASDYEENWQFYANTPAHPISIEDNMRLSRLGPPVLAPNGLVVVFTRTQFDQRNLNRSATSLWFYNLPFTDGYAALPLTRPVWGVHDSQPNFDSYSRLVFFLSNRDGEDVNGVAPLTQIFQVGVPFPSSIPSIPMVEPVSYMGGLGAYVSSWWKGNGEAQQELADSPSQRARAFRKRLLRDTPEQASQGAHAEYASAQSYRFGSGPSLPDAAQATYMDPLQLTAYEVSVDNLLLGRNAASSRTIFAFSARVFPNMSMSETARALQARRASGASFHSYDTLFVRHWDEWLDGTRSHIHFLAMDQADDGSVSAVSAPVDVMHGMDSDAPTRPGGSVASEWSFSSSAVNFAFVRQTYDGYSNVSWTDNTDISVVRINATTFLGGPFSREMLSAPECRTCDNLAMDTSPTFSPIDDNIFVYLSSSIPGYESDRMSIKVYVNSNLTVDLTPDWEYSVHSLAWTASGVGLYVGVATHGRHRVVLFTLQEHSTLVNETLVLSDHSSGDLQVSPDDSFFLFTRSSFQAPSSLFVLYFNASIYNVSIGDLGEGFNSEALSKMQLVETQELYYAGAGNDSIQSWVFEPAGFNPSSDPPGKKYPMVLLIHGGPQQAWGDEWSYRWNPQIWAAQGYFVAMINFHGSNGFGQSFIDSIAGNYGTLPYEDLMLGLEYLLSDSPYANYIDPDRVGAAGASFGGYMVNWIAGANWNATRKFQALVCHDGMFDTRAFYYSTDELWFPEHDLGGLPWEQPENYERFNPADPARIKQWNTPMMIVHGGLDYRIDESQGIGAFTALQRLGVPSKLLYFPNEAHQVFNSQNQIEWHREVLGWIGQYTAPKPAAADEQRDEI